MDYLIGLLTGVVLFIVFYLGYRMGLGHNQVPKAKPPDMDPEEQQRLKKLNEDFANIFSYDVKTALQRKKV
ncbi:hypothetical protein [Paenisporosarcina cavernae]|uniref:Uncharacterized protein n=1 Tax=Paenisporosarcina cavernae TaxID=2320858 RepID=A0A385YVD5_9BACL|nr:hypothetical protein [Paenisporosarcina cavernae]AYC29648.1 hypothetical protein D3873_07005 [Paenisporosarcina cavernae]AYC30012.1 hypothetical protein D3873_09060 [Paenisporosarcina cavernae]